MHAFQLTPRSTPGSQVSEQENNTHQLTISAGPAGEYRLAQLDDYQHLSRAQFPWRPPLTITLEARASRSEIPGTWGFGLWNDPFGIKLGFGGEHLLPALPNAAWFFFASPPNHLSLSDRLPGRGALAATFRAPPIPAWVLAPGLLALPLLRIRPAARMLRKLASMVIPQDAVQLDIDPTSWHRYRLDWDKTQVAFSVDGSQIYSTHITPRGPLGFVLWIDNQFAAWSPDGRLNYGTLPSESHSIELKDLVIQPGAPE